MHCFAEEFPTAVGFQLQASAGHELEFHGSKTHLKFFKKLCSADEIQAVQKMDVFQRRTEQLRTRIKSLSLADELASYQLNADEFGRACAPEIVPDSRDRTCIIFDWDDTLFPTSCVQSRLEKEKGAYMQPYMEESMAIHMAVVVDLLRTARSFARVAIVSLAARSWIHSSARRYWPDFDFAKLLVELDIPVYYAREHLAFFESGSELQQGVNLGVVAKRNAMSRCVRTFNKKSRCTTNNLISIGDSLVEHEAMKLVGGSMASETLCKSVLLSYKPTIANLTDNIRTLIPCIGWMVAMHGDFDLDLSKS